MSGQDEKFEIIDEAKVKYQRLQSLLKRANVNELPIALAAAIADYQKQGSISQSLDFLAALRGNYGQIDVPADLRPELERIVNWSEWNKFISEKDQARRSADYIHLRR